MAEKRATTGGTAKAEAAIRRAARECRRARKAADRALAAGSSAGPPPLPSHKEIRLAAITALARAFGGDWWFDGKTVTLPSPAEPPTNHHGARVPNEVAFVRGLCASAGATAWHGPVLAYGFHADAVLLTLAKLAMGARLELPGAKVEG